MTELPQFELLTRAGCHLCDEMADVLDTVLPEFGLSYTPIDVDTVAELRETFGDVVPVLRRDGRAVAKVRLAPRDLRRIVRRRR